MEKVEEIREIHCKLVKDLLECCEEETVIEFMNELV